MKYAREAGKPDAQAEAIAARVLWLDLCGLHDCVAECSKRPGCDYTCGTMNALVAAARIGKRGPL